MPPSATHFPDKFLTLAEMMNISEQEFERRKQYQQFGPEDGAHLQKLASVSENFTYAEDVMDSFAARILRAITVMTRLMGAKVAIAGIQPEIAFSMVQLGLRLEGTMTSLDLEDGIAMLKAADKTNGLGNYGR